MKHFCIPLFTIICVAFGAAAQSQAQTYSSGSLGGSSGFGAGAIGSGLTSGVNNPLVNGSSGLKLDSNSLRSSLPDVNALRAPELNIGTPAETGVFVPERAQEDQTVYQVDTTPTSSSYYDQTSSYNSFAAAGGDPPPPPEKGEDGDGDDYSEDAEDDDEQVETDKQEKGLNWWLWGPICIVGFIVVMNVLGRNNA